MKQINFDELAAFVVGYMPEIIAGLFNKFVEDLTAKFELTEDLIEVIVNFVEETATQKDDELTPPFQMTNDNSTAQIENPASDNNSDGNGKGGDIAAVVETSEPFYCERQDTADRLIELENELRDGTYTYGEREHLRELIDRTKYRLEQEEAEMYAESENEFTINRFSEEPQQTPLEELIEEYNETKDAAKKLGHVAGAIHRLMTQKDNSYYYPAQDYEKQYGKEYIDAAINRHYWEQIFSYDFFQEVSGAKTYNLYQSTMVKLTKVEFNKENIHNILSDFKAECKAELLADVVSCFGTVLKDDLRWKHWHKENDQTPLMVEKKIILNSDDKVREVEKVIQFFDDGQTEKEYAPIMDIIHQAKNENNLKKVDTRYFKVDIFKGNRYHLTFKNLSLLRKFNLYVNKITDRLPASYGVLYYCRLTAGERCLVNKIEGKKTWEDCKRSYEELRNNYDNYNVNPFETYWNNFVNSNKYLAEIFG